MKLEPAYVMHLERSGLFSEDLTTKQPNCVSGWLQNSGRAREEVGTAPQQTVL